MDVIQTHGLSKRYLLGARADRHRMLGDALTSAFRRTARRPAAATIWALDNVTASVRDGEVLGMVGANGAGKSTLLKILTRITRPTAGVARTRGRVGALLEVGTGFHPELTGRENIYLNGAVLGMSRADIRRRFDEIVAFSGVEEFLDTPVKRYSSGMYLRLAFSVAAHLEPDIVIVDEVLAVGDVDFQRRCLGKMSEFGAAGRTVVFVSHDLGSIGRLCSRVWWLDQGRIMMDGRAEDVVETYLRSFERGRGRNGGSTSIGSGPLKVEAVGLVDERGNAVTHPRRDHAFAVRIRAAVQERVRALDFSVYLLDQKGHRVLDDAWSEHNAGVLVDDPGDYELTIMIPPLLAPGRYTLGVWAGGVGEDFLHGELMSFEVLPRPDDRHASVMKERIVQPPLLWKVERSG